MSLTEMGFTWCPHCQDYVQPTTKEFTQTRRRVGSHVIRDVTVVYTCPVAHFIKADTAQEREEGRG